MAFDGAGALREADAASLGAPLLGETASTSSRLEQEQQRRARRRRRQRSSVYELDTEHERDDDHHQRHRFGSYREDSDRESGDSDSDDEESEDDESLEDGDDVVGKSDMACKVCGKEDNVLTLQPCEHKSLCQTCYDEQEQDDVHCPVCMTFVASYKTVEDEWEELAKEQERLDREMDLDLAQERGNQMVGASQLAQMFGIRRRRHEKVSFSGFQVAEVDLKDCFGVGVSGHFKQTRLLAVLMVVWTLCSAPLLATLFTSTRAAVSTRGLSLEDQAQLFLRRWSVITCTVDICRLYFEYFLLADVGGALLAALLALWLGRITRHRRHRVTGQSSTPEIEVASRSLLVIQAPHLHDPLRKETLEEFFLGEQVLKIQRQKRVEQSYGRRARFVREVTPPLVHIKLTGILNYSLRDLEFARQAEIRLRLLEQIRSLQYRLENTRSHLKEHRQTLDEMQAKRTELERLEREYFADLFLQRDLGVERFAKVRTDFAFLTFRSASHASFARQMLHNDKRWWMYHHFCLMFGAPLTRLRAIGSVEEVYPSNIDWFRLERPHQFAQSGGPARFVIFLGALVATLDIGGYFLWNAVCETAGAVAGGVVLVMWSRISRAAVFLGFERFGHPLRSFTLYYGVVTTALCVDLVQYVGWPIVWGLLNNGVAGTFEWWRDRVLICMATSELLHLVLAVAWGLVGGTLLQRLRRVYLGQPFTQVQLDKLWEPPEWKLPLAVCETVRTAVVCVVFSAGIPFLLPLGAISLATRYSSEKNRLVNHCQLPFRVATSHTGVAVARMVEVAIMLRIALSFATVLQLFELHDFFDPLYPPTVPYGLPVVAMAGLACLLVVGYLHRISQIASASYNIATCGGLLCWPYRVYEAYTRPIVVSPDLIRAKATNALLEARAATDKHIIRHQLDTEGLGDDDEDDEVDGDESDDDQDDNIIGQFDIKRDGRPGFGAPA
ncbi:RING-type domain-containing protein [Durusdinium trenchii]|uniref:RING-type domain-containing protein n=1 Tax=Durusdinium trenchii TaxID=1381693 RepID=A0ABP0HGI5_9DINO